MKQGGKLRIFNYGSFFIGIVEKWGDITYPSVTSFSAHTSGARGLKFGSNNHLIGGTKFTYQNFDILSRS